MEPTPQGFPVVPPGSRSERFRRGARVIVVADGAILLLADTDPGVAGSRWWVTPGGGIDPGESERQAAAREVAEELGLVVPDSELIGPVAVREVVHGYSDRILHQHETFFVLMLDSRFEPDQAGHTAKELLTLDGWAWIEVADLDRQTEPVWPSWLAQFARPWDGVTHDFGEVEESTAPVE